jgi:hypothetical protein
MPQKKKRIKERISKGKLPKEMSKGISKGNVSCFYIPTYLDVST